MDARFFPADFEYEGFSVAEAAALDAINDRVGAGADLASVLGFVLESTRGLLPTDRLSVAFVGEGGQRLRAAVTVAVSSPLGLDEGFAGDVAGSTLARGRAAGGPRVIPDRGAWLETHPRSPSTRLLVDEGVSCSMTCPLVVEGHTVGLLFRSSRQRDVYGDREVGLHQAMAVRLAQAVEKTWRIRQLEESNRAFTEVLAFVTHELKAPLASMISLGNVLTEGLLGEMEARQGDAVARMVGQGTYLMGLVKDYLDLARLEGRDGGPEQREADLVADVIAPVLERLAPQVEERGILLETDLPEEPLVRLCEPGLLQIAVTNLVSNGIKYGNEGGRVRVGLERADGAARIVVWNEGPGFPADQRKHLFKRFSRLKSPELMARKGTGVGLYTTWRVVGLHGGTIRARSERGAWAEFTIDLPASSQA